MKNTIWLYGLLAGVISIIWGILGESVIGDSMTLNTRMIIGYATMVLAFSLIFVAVKNHRDMQNHGHITFGKALSIGLLITLIASTVYVLIWMVVFKYFMADFGTKYQTQAIAEMQASGMSAIEVKKQSAEMAEMMKKYETNAAYRIMFTYIEILPAGIIMSLLAAFITKKNNKPIQVKA